MNQTYPRLIALGSRKRAKRAALSRAGPIFVESEAGRSIVIESLRARALVYAPLSSPSPVNDDSSSSSGLGTVNENVILFSRQLGRRAPFLHFSTYGIVWWREGGKVGPRAKSIRRTVFAVVKRRSDTTLARGHFRCRRPRSSYRF